MGFGFGKPATVLLLSLGAVLQIGFPGSGVNSRMLQAFAASGTGGIHRTITIKATGHEDIRPAVVALPNLPRRLNSNPSAYVYPLMTPRLSSGYGPRGPIRRIRTFSHTHHGIDLAAPVGSPIRAVKSGVVVFADPYAGFGKLVVIKHDDHMTSHYAHCDNITIRPGQVVKAGQIIAAVGSTGLSTGPHLHFEIRIDGKPQNPELFIRGLAAQAQG